MPYYDGRKCGGALDRDRNMAMCRKTTGALAEVKDRT